MMQYYNTNNRDLSAVKTDSDTITCVSALSHTLRVYCLNDWVTNDVEHISIFLITSLNEDIVGIVFMSAMSVIQDVCPQFRPIATN